MSITATSKPLPEEGIKDPDWLYWERSRWRVVHDPLPIEDGGFNSGAIFPDNQVKEMMKFPDIMRTGMILFNRHAQVNMTVHQREREYAETIKVYFVETTTHELAEAGIL